MVAKTSSLARPASKVRAKSKAKVIPQASKTKAKACAKKALALGTGSAKPSKISEVVPLALFNAAGNGAVAKVKLLLAGHADVDQRGPNGDTPLMRAAGNGKTEVVKLLLAGKADVNATDPRDGGTALHGAVVERRAEVAKLLLSSKADANARNRSGESPLHFLVQPDISIAKMLVGAGADVNAVGREGTPLHGQDSPQVVKFLIENRANVNAKDRSQGGTPLHRAARLCRLPLARLLLASGADVKAKNKRGEAPINVIWEACRGSEQMRDCLRKYGAK